MGNGKGTVIKTFGWLFGDYTDELEKTKPNERITASKRNSPPRKWPTPTRKRADTVIIENKIADAFSRAGGRPQARAFIVVQAAGMFTVEKGELMGTKHSPTAPASRCPWMNG